MIKKVNFDEVPIAETPHKVDVRKAFAFEHAVVVQITLKPGESLLPHITPVDALFIGLEGEGIVVIGNEEEKLGVNDLVFSPKDIKHLLKNESDKNFRFLVLKVPKPTKETKLL